MPLPVVMLVDDDSELLESLTELLEFTGYRVHAFGSAEAALASRDSIAKADVLLADYNLGGINGLDLIRRIRQRRAQLPSAILSGFARHVADAVTDEPDVRLFAKPVSVIVLEAYLQDALADAASDHTRASV